jgi:hypothetical protein
MGVPVFVLHFGVDRGSRVVVILVFVSHGLI